MHLRLVNQNRSSSQAAMGSKARREQASSSLQAVQHLGSSEHPARSYVTSKLSSALQTSNTNKMQQPRIGGVNQKALINATQIRNNRKLQQQYAGGSLGSANILGGGANSHYSLQPQGFDGSRPNNESLMGVNGSQNNQYLQVNDDGIDSNYSGQQSHLRTPFK